jgi:hypothetical protein
VPLASGVVVEARREGAGEGAGTMASGAASPSGAPANGRDAGWLNSPSRAGNSDMAVNSKASTTPPPSRAVRVRRARRRDAVGESVPWTGVSGLPCGAI